MDWNGGPMELQWRRLFMTSKMPYTFEVQFF